MDERMPPELHGRFMQCMTYNGARIVEIGHELGIEDAICSDDLMKSWVALVQIIAQIDKELSNDMASWFDTLDFTGVTPEQSDEMAENARQRPLTNDTAEIYLRAILTDVPPSHFDHFSLLDLFSGILNNATHPQDLVVIRKVVEWIQSDETNANQVLQKIIHPEPEA